MRQPVAPAFFEFWPPLGAPSLNNRFVALAGTLDGLLRGPLQGFEQTRNLGGTIKDAELLPDNGGHPRTGPHLAAKAPHLSSMTQKIGYQA